MLSNRQTQRGPIAQTWAAGLDAFKIAVDAEPAESGHFRSFSYQG
jgi:hypothetical protein